MKGSRSQEVRRRLFLAGSFVAVGAFNIILACAFHAFIDRGRGLYGSLVFTLFVALFGQLVLWYVVSSAFNEKRQPYQRYILPKVHAPSRKPTIVFVVLIAVAFTTMDLIGYTSNRALPPLSLFAQELLWLSYFIAQFAYDRWAWLQARAGAELRSWQPLMQYANPIFITGISVTVYWGRWQIFPGWLLAIFAFYGMLLIVVLVAALLQLRSNADA